MKCRHCGREFRFLDNADQDVIDEVLCFWCWDKKHPCLFPYQPELEIGKPLEQGYLATQEVPSATEEPEYG